MVYSFRSAIHFFVLATFVTIAAGDDLNYISDEYQRGSADQKFNQVWSSITKDTSIGSWPFVGVIFAESVNDSFDRAADGFPVASLWPPQLGRFKAIHSLGGAVVQVTWKDLGGHPYTGVFAGGSTTGLIRFSIAREVDKGNYKVGAGLKFFRSGRKSANFVAMWSLSGQNSPDFFGNEWTNHVQLGVKQGDMEVPQRLLLQKFLTASNHPQYIGLSDMAKFNSSGAQASKVVMPFQLFLVPTGRVQGKQSNAKGCTANLGSQACPDPFQFGQFQAGTDLWDVYAIAEPNQANRVKIATITTRTRFTDSKFGDEGLFFQHQRMEEDIALRPEWKSKCGTIEFNGQPPLPFNEVQELDDDIEFISYDSKVKTVQVASSSSILNVGFVVSIFAGIVVFTVGIIVGVVVTNRSN